MKKTKKERLAQLLPLLDQLQEQLRVQAAEPYKITSKGTKFDPVVYAPLATLLYGSKKLAKLESKTAWQDSIKNAKMVRAAKNLTIACNDDVISLFTALGEQLVASIKAINPSSTLTPKIRRIEGAIDAPWKNAEVFAEGLYQNYMPDLFNQGRLHQVVFNPKLPLAKFAHVDIDDSQAAFAIEARLMADFKLGLDKLSQNFRSYVSDLVANGTSRDDLNEMIELHISASAQDFLSLVRSHTAECYASGNLHQMAKDKVQWVRWQTGQHNDDCGRCRAIQMGDIIIEGIKHERLDFDRVVYYLPDVVAVTKEKGARSFNHDGCRCTFVVN